MSYIPQDDKDRKGLPLWQFTTGYFPKAIREMCKVSVVNNVRYNPNAATTDISWNRSKSQDQLGSSFRHMMEAVVDGKVFDEVPPEIVEKTGIKRIYVLAANAWRACAALELEIEKQEAKERAAELEFVEATSHPTVLAAGLSGHSCPYGGPAEYCRDCAEKLYLTWIKSKR